MKFNATVVAQILHFIILIYRKPPLKTYGLVP